MIMIQAQNFSYKMENIESYMNQSEYFFDHRKSADSQGVSIGCWHHFAITRQHWIALYDDDELGHDDFINNSVIIIVELFGIDTFSTI